MLDNRTVILLITTFAAISVASYGIGARLAKRRSQAWLLIGLTLPLSAFLVVNYTPPGDSLERAGSVWVVPISIGFFVLRQAHFVYERYRGSMKPAGLLEFLTYVFFFPTVIAGPLERFDRLRAQVRNTFAWIDLSEGVERIVLGCFKKFIVADVLLAALLPPALTTQSGFEEASWGVVLFACATRFLYVYFDFSGYTDIALGTARLFGFKLIENFNYPLLRSNLAEFWRAWHISLSTFARDYVYFPLLARYRNSTLAVIATMLAIASWHGTSPGWVLWGLHHGAGLVLLARFQRNARKLPWLELLRATVAWRVLAMLATWIFVACGYALTWHPDDIMLSLRIYGRLWSLGLWS